jgi:hypothetical protein
MLAGKRIYQEGRVGERKNLLMTPLEGKKMAGSEAKEHNAPKTGLKVGFIL